MSTNCHYDTVSAPSTAVNECLINPQSTGKRSRGQSVAAGCRIQSRDQFWSFAYDWQPSICVWSVNVCSLCMLLINEFIACCLWSRGRACLLCVWLFHITSPCSRPGYMHSVFYSVVSAAPRKVEGWLLGRGKSFLPTSYGWYRR